MPYSLLDPVQVNKLLLKAFHCRSLSSASHTSCIFDMAVKLNKPCTDTVWYLSDCPLPSHPGGWLCMKLSATELLTSSHLFLIQPFLWSPGTEMRALYTPCSLDVDSLCTHLCSWISEGQVILEHPQVQHCWWPTVTLGAAPDAGQPWDAGSCFSPSAAKWCLLSSVPANKCEMVFVFLYVVW